MTTLSNVERMNLSNAKALRRAREQLKVTKVELASKLDVSVKTIDRLENGDGPLTDDKIKPLLSAVIPDPASAILKMGELNWIKTGSPILW